MNHRIVPTRLIERIFIIVSDKTHTLYTEVYRLHEGYSVFVVSFARSPMATISWRSVSHAATLATEDLSGNRILLFLTVFL